MDTDLQTKFGDCPDTGENQMNSINFKKLKIVMWVIKWVNLSLTYNLNNNSTDFLDFTGEDMFTTKSNGLEFSCGRFLIKFLDNRKVAQVNKANNIWIHCL